MLIGNGSRLASNPMRNMGGTQFLNDLNISRVPASAKLNQWIGFRKTASSPQGANPHDAWIRSKVSGSLNSYGQIKSTSTVTAWLTKGFGVASNVNGAGTVSNTSDMTLITALIAGAGKLVGLGTLEASMVGSLSMVADLAGNGEVESSLGLIAWIVADILGAGSADGSTMRGDGFMSSTITSAGDLVTAQSCAAAVWNAIAAEYLTDGTTGKALASAGSAGDPWSGIMAGYTDDATFGAFVKKLLTTGKFLGLK
jgi:hypothetical protein